MKLTTSIDEQASLRMHSVDGKITAILFEEGERVEQGALLAQMDDAEQQVVVESARLQAESNAEIDRARFARDEAVIRAIAVQLDAEGEDGRRRSMEVFAQKRRFGDSRSEGNGKPECVDPVIVVPLGDRWVHGK